MATIRTITYYPVKGCAGVSAGAAELTPAGPRHDRTFLIVDGDGVGRTQRTDPELAVIRPRIDAAGERLTLDAPGTDPVEVTVDLGRPRREVRMLGNPYPAIDQGDEAADWLSGVLGAPSRLVRMPPEHRRETGGHTPGTAAFADSQAIVAISQSSLDLLNERIAEAGGEPLPMDRFRPNLVLGGWAEPHTEDRVRTMIAGDAELGYAKLDIRCVVTTVDQSTGVKDGPEPLRTLARYRRTAAGGVAFGMKAAVVRTGKVSAGDEVIVPEWGEPER
jgi:uncharacterized protein YcbX